MDNIRDLINSILNQNSSMTSNILDTEMKDRIAVLTDVKKREIAQDIFDKNSVVALLLY